MSSLSNLFDIRRTVCSDVGEYEYNIESANINVHTDNTTLWTHRTITTITTTRRHPIIQSLRCFWSNISTENIDILHKERPEIASVLSTINLKNNDTTKSITAGSKKTSLCWFKSNLTTETINILHEERLKVQFVL